MVDLFWRQVFLFAGDFLRQVNLDSCTLSIKNVAYVRTRLLISLQTDTKILVPAAFYSVDEIYQCDPRIILLFWFKNLHALCSLKVWSMRGTRCYTVTTPREVPVWHCKIGWHKNGWCGWGLRSSPVPVVCQYGCVSNVIHAAVLHRLVPIHVVMNADLWSPCGRTPWINIPLDAVHRRSFSQKLLLHGHYLASLQPAMLASQQTQAANASSSISALRNITPACNCCCAAGPASNLWRSSRATWLDLKRK